MGRRWVVIVVLVAAVGAIIWLDGGSPRRPVGDNSAASLRDLVPALASGEPDALPRARSAAWRDWEGSFPCLAEMLADGNWRLRAAACEILGARREANLVALLFPRASDSDWRVRSAAFEALGRAKPLPRAAPLRDTPLDEREGGLLAWLAAWDAGAARPLAADLCELYAGDGHVEFGRPMTARCLACHAGASPRLPEADGACATCHPAIHSQWAASAHANSLTHLHLATADANTREARLVDFGAMRGISCLECHRRADAAAAAPAAGPTTASAAPPPSAEGAPAGRGTSCPIRFDASMPARESCRRCHDTTWEEWRRWQVVPHARRLAWPPGEVDLSADDDRRTCVDCHMRPVPDAEGARARDHAWSARRAPEFLRDGIEASVLVPRAKGASQPAARLALVNLAGHGYPTGSRRRGLRLWAGGEAAIEGPPLATFSPIRPGLAAPGVQPALRPGETREFPVVPGEGLDVFYRLQYVRHLAEPNGYAVDVITGRGGAGP